MTILGSGNCGCKLALMLEPDALLFSTAEQDTNNYIRSKNIVVVSSEGASKRFRAGVEIWQKNEEVLRRYLNGISNDRVVIFSSLGGGSGSSSLYPMSRILKENGNKVLIVGVLPYKKEINPPLSNAVQSINSLMPVISDVSVMLFDNEKLIKEFDADWNEINKHIVKKADYVVNLLSKYNSNDEYSPLTLDQSELDSVVFGGGFVDISDTFIEEGMPKFEYGAVDRETKNCLVAMFVDSTIRSEIELDDYHRTFTNTVSRLSGRVPNARMIPGILRARVNSSNSKDETIRDRAYFTIASGLGIEKYMIKIEKLRDEAVKRATAYAEKQKSVKVFGNKESKVLDI